MSGITSAIVASTGLLAVFIPVTMMGGTSGVFYFAVRYLGSVAVGLSALTLTQPPALRLKS